MTEGKGHSTWFPGARPPAGIDPTAPSTPILGADPLTADYRTTVPQHVWLRLDTGKVPGLLLEWRRRRGNRIWEARVVHGELVADEWVTVNGWYLQGRLEQIPTVGGPA